jgi:hypothetical protein
MSPSVHCCVTSFYIQRRAAFPHPLLALHRVPAALFRCFQSFLDAKTKKEALPFQIDTEKGVPLWGAKNRNKDLCLLRSVILRHDNKNCCKSVVKIRALQKISSDLLYKTAFFSACVPTWISTVLRRPGCGCPPSEDEALPRHSARSPRTEAYRRNRYPS